MIVVSNASPLIGLSKIKNVDLLKELFNKVYISKAVRDEIVKGGKGRAGSKEVLKSSWIVTKEVKNRLAVEVLLTELKAGEAETIVLAEEVKAGLILVDEKKARNVALEVGLKVLGTAGILAYAKKKGLVKNLKEMLDQLRESNFWIGDDVYQKVLTL